MSDLRTEAGIWMGQVVVVEFFLAMLVFDPFFWKHNQIESTSLIVFTTTSVVFSGLLLFYRISKADLQ